MRGEKFTKAVVITLVCVLAAYLIFSVTRFSGDSYSVYKAVLYEVGDGLTTSGFLVRSEIVLEAHTDDIIVLTRAEGEKVGRGQAVAATYRDTAARERRSRIEELEAELKQMQYAASFSSSDLETATLDTDILRLVNQVTVSAARRDFAAANTASETLKPYALRRYLTSGDAAVLERRIDAVQTRLNELYAAASSESGTVNAPVSGYFSAVTDGYESRLTPAFLETATVRSLKKFEGLTSEQTGALGKLVTSQKWYFAAIVPSESVAELAVGSRISVNFANDFYSALRMKVERVSPPEDGESILVLSSESSIQEAVSARTETADLVFSSLSGLRVPKTAIYVNEAGQSGVYVLVGAEARWKTIRILTDYGDSYIVELDKSSTDNLWPEDEIILTTGEMFNGKVLVS